MVMKNSRKLAGLIGAVALGVTTLVNTGCKPREGYFEKVTVDRKVDTRIERDKLVDGLEIVSGGRLFDKDAIFDSKLENKDLESFVRLYRDDKKFREDENWGEDYNEFNPNTDLGIEKLAEYERDTPGLNLVPEGYLISPKDYIWSDADKTAVAQYMIMKGDVDLGAITFF